jgi:hypothetical protein
MGPHLSSRFVRTGDLEHFMVDVIYIGVMVRSRPLFLLRPIAVSYTNLYGTG